ncbi:hypothetical protein ACEQPO_07645 [Bacillus sp. SL00103]
MDIKADPELTTVTRWKTSMPQYHVGHQKAISNMRETFKQSYLVFISQVFAFEGVGIPDCIDQGKAAISEAVSYYFHKKTTPFSVMEREFFMFGSFKRVGNHKCEQSCCIWEKDMVYYFLYLMTKTFK